MVEIVIGIATAGRPEILHSTLGYVARQTRPPDRVILCPAAAGDAGQAGYAVQADLVFGPRGLPSQRNTILDAAGGADIVIFLDDDFFIAPDFIAETEKLFFSHNEIVMATGTLLADGINGPGLTEAFAKSCIEHSRQRNETIEPAFSGYGCNMAIRMAPVRERGLRFDAALPLYGWLEDLDFTRRLAPFGRIVKSSNLQGVHLGIKGGRNSGVRFGYSQVANPLYMAGKGSLSLPRALIQMSKNILKNSVKSAKPEAWVDRRGRLKGNFLALADLLRGRLSPGRILELE